MIFLLKFVNHLALRSIACFCVLQRASVYFVFYGDVTLTSIASVVVMLPDASMSKRLPVSESIHQFEPSSHQFTTLPYSSGSAAVHWISAGCPQEVKLNTKVRMMAIFVDVVTRLLYSNIRKQVPFRRANNGVR